MFKYWKSLAASAVVCASVAAACSRDSAALTIEEEHALVCGNCHLLPAPQDMPKAIWTKSVLPNMAARVGLAYGDYNPNKGLSMEEQYQVTLAGVYPTLPQVDSAMWWRVHDYIVAMAPDSIPVDTARRGRHQALAGFEVQGLRLGDDQRAFVTGAHYSAATHSMVISDMAGGLFRAPSGKTLPTRGTGPVVGFAERPQDTLVTVIGGMNPSQLATGSVYFLRGGQQVTVADKLHRPVYAATTDFDGDGREEVLVCEFGYYTGALTLLQPVGSAYERQTLLDLPGTIKFEVLDFDGDGYEDIVVLASQGAEGVYVLYGDGALGFRVEQLVRLPPHYGSSWFELVDMDGDGDLDIVLANGDNADYSIFAKPYHGLRIFSNDGERSFTETYFYPMYGCTRVAAADYDGDGDVDLAVTAFFADFVRNPSEAFVYFEQVDGAARFVTYTTEAAGDGRWLLMEKGDYDGDGDVDVVLGSFMMPPPEDAQAVMTRWMAKGVDVLLLENGGR